jgi:hypothetical protein
MYINEFKTSINEETNKYNSTKTLENDFEFDFN